MRSGLVEILIHDGYLKSPHIVSAFDEVARADFVPSEFESEADVDIPLPIGFGQTISQPTIVALMLELLDPQKGHRTLDVGSGSGWTSALLGHIVGEKGKVVALDFMPELCEMTRKNVDKFDLIKAGIVECLVGDGQHGYPECQPYDRILVSASLDEIPNALKKQLVIGGKMVIPVRNHLCYLERRSDDEFYKEDFPGFTLAPLVEKSY
jgi:protein-L-isoaspartate(D-aspartate) O-methyltransferase